jgi:hypothetical protein
LIIRKILAIVCGYAVLLIIWESDTYAIPRMYLC